MAPRATFSLNLPEREPDEPPITEEQRAVIGELLTELKAKGAMDPRVLDSLGTRQAGALINGLTEVRVWVNATDSEPNGQTRFILRDPSQPREVVSAPVSNSELPTGSWYTLHFQPDWSSAGKLYELTIQGESPGSLGPKIAYSLRQEYPEGKLFENEEPISKDLIFQTGCLAGWEEIDRVDSP